MKSTKFIAGLLIFIFSFGILFLPTPQEFPTIAITASAAEKKLPAPKNIKASVGNGKVTLSWDTVDGADGYRIYQYDAVSKKYKKIKTIKGTKSTIKDLKEGKNYYYKIAAVKKSGKSYKAGTASKKVTVTTKKAVAKAETMTAVNVNVSDMKGVWEYYDYRYLKKYTDASKYNPNNPDEPELDGFLVSLQIIDDKNLYATVNYSDGVGMSKTTFTNSSINVTKFANWNFGGRYKIYSYGEDKYMFLQFINGDGENTYVFKYKPITFEKIDSKNDIEGKWISVAFSNYKFDENKLYVPTNCREKLSWAYLTEITVKGNALNYTFSEDGETSTSSEKNNPNLYAVYKIDNSLYMYYYWNNDFYYVLVKK